MIRTWHLEAFMVAVVLAFVAVATGNHWREWVCAAGVLGSFMHAQVSDRLAEREASRAVPAVDCHRMARVYFIACEIAWFAYFASGRCWSALVGCALFLAYPAWRRWWRTHRPLEIA